MKKIYAALSTLALLFSLPSLANDLIDLEKNNEPSKEQAESKSEKDKILVKDGATKAEAPQCGIGGGG
jgi:hypothetical protein